DRRGRIADCNGIACPLGKSCFKYSIAMTSLAGPTSAKTPIFVLWQDNSARSSVRGWVGAEKCRPRASRCLAFRDAGNSQLLTLVQPSPGECLRTCADVG